MAGVLVEYNRDVNQSNILATFTVAADVVGPIPIPPALSGAAITQRSLAQTYTVLVETSSDNVNWVTGATITNASPTSTISATAVGVARFVKLTLSALGGAQTVSIQLGFRR